MVIRMFRYGFEKAIELAGSKDADPPIILEFPRQLVIFLEENEEIPYILTMERRMPNGEVISYTVPVMKYWRYTAEELKAQKMYALLPLQAFKSRKKIDSIYKSHKPDSVKSRLITEQFGLLKETIQHTVSILGELHDQQEIRTGDLERILRVLQNINDYLYQRYGEYQTIEEEVHHMVKTLYDPLVKQEGIKEGKLELAKSLISLGVDLATVIKATEFTTEEIKQLQDKS